MKKCTPDRIREYRGDDCKHCTHDGYCTVFECRCDTTGYCGVKS